MSNNSNLSRLAPRLQTDGNIPIATSTVLGGVKQGSGISIANDGTISATGAVHPQGFQLYTSGSDNWVVPTGVSFIKATLVGGGGGGGGAIGTAATKGPGGGGGGGAWATFFFNVTPGDLIPYNIGAGGAGNAGAAGATGGVTTFNGQTVNGGGGGLLYAGTETSNRGVGANDPNLLPSQGYSGPGGNGASGVANATQGFSGSGGGSATSAGSIYYLARLVTDALSTPGRGILGGRAAGAISATANNAIYNGVAASGYGNGGSGASILTGSTATSNAQGGAGSGGAVLVEWY